MRFPSSWKFRMNAISMMLFILSFYSYLRSLKKMAEGLSMGFQKEKVDNGLTKPRMWMYAVYFDRSLPTRSSMLQVVPIESANTRWFLHFFETAPNEFCLFMGLL
jgi:hypothetical protein